MPRNPGGLNPRPAFTLEEDMTYNPGASHWKGLLSSQPRRSVERGARQQGGCGSYRPTTRLQQQVDEHRRVAFTELQVHQIETRMGKIESSGPLQQLLEESRSHYADLFDLAPVRLLHAGHRDRRIRRPTLALSAASRRSRDLIERLLVSFVADEQAEYPLTCRSVGTSACA